MSNTDDSDNTTAAADNGSDTAAGLRPRLSRRAWALLAVATVAVASVAGAAVWAFNSQDSAAADVQDGGSGCRVPARFAADAGRCHAGDRTVSSNAARSHGGCHRDSR